MALSSTSDLTARACDAERLRTLIALIGRDKAEGLITRVIETIDCYVNSASSGPSNSDLTDRRVAHNLRGLASLYGLVGLADAAALLEMDLLHDPAALDTALRIVVARGEEAKSILRGVLSGFD